MHFDEFKRIVILTEEIVSTTLPSKEPAKSGAEFCGNWLLAMTVTEFISLCDLPEELDRRLCEQHLQDFNEKACDSERRSWQTSLPALAEILQKAGLTDQMIILEYLIPCHDGEFPERIDAIICGCDEARKSHALCIELKQWDGLSLRSDPEPGFLQIRYEREWKKKKNPRKQIEDYRKKMIDLFNICGLADDVLIFDVYAYLHNASHLPDDKKYILFGNQGIYDADSRLYTNEYAPALISKIRQKVGYGSSESAFAVFKEFQMKAYTNINSIPKRQKTLDFEARKEYAIAMQKKRRRRIFRRVVIALIIIGLWFAIKR